MSALKGLESPEEQNSQSCETLENSQVNESLVNSQNTLTDTSSLEEVVSSKPLRLLDLETPLFGVYVASSEGKHSPIFSIFTKDGLKRIIGVTDLSRKMGEVAIGDLVYIAFSGTKQTSNGYWMQIADVRTRELTEEEKAGLPFDLSKYTVS